MKAPSPSRRRSVCSNSEPCTAVPTSTSLSHIRSINWDQRAAATVSTVSAVELGTNSEVGTLRVAILHRPGAELRRLNPGNNDQLLFDGLPWVSRAQDEHDQFAELLRSRGVEVLLMSELLTEALQHSGAARMQGVAAAVDARRLGAPLAQELSVYLRGLDPVRLGHVLTAGMTFNELPSETR